MAKVVGIDLGTTNSCVAYSDGRQTQVIPNKGGYRITPSVVAVMEDRKKLVGQIAKRQAITNPENTVFSAKRLIGRRIDSAEAKIARAIYPYRLVDGPHGDIRVECYGREYSLPEISSIVLLEMKHVAEAHLHATVEQAVITVPAYFNDNQRQATKDAGKIAGLDVLRIINEPTAAAIAYGFNKKDNRTIAVFDLGGGTFDISVLEIQGGVFKVLATSGDTFLGGDDIDNLLIDYAAEAFLRDRDFDLRQNRMALQRLKDACEKAKVDLSNFREVEISLPFIAQVGSEPLHLSMTFQRTKLEELTRPLLEKTLKISESCLKMAEVDRDDLDDVLLVGGQTRMPLLQDMVSNFFKRSPNKQVHPDEVVAVGAAIQAAALTSKEEEVEMVLLDVTPLPLGIKSAGGTFTKLIEANTTVPVSAHKIFTTVTDDQPTVRIQTYQGNSPVADENELLGEFLLTGIRKAKAGEPEIDVSFHIDANGIVQVSAKDLYTGQSQSITVTMSSGLTNDEVEGMKQAAADYEVELKGREESEGLSQKADLLLHKLKKSFDEKGGKLKADQKKTISTLLNDAPGFIEQKDAKKLKILIEQLEIAAKALR
ncbi:MAG TPA: molecular chaperone DnaK [Bdellovibrionota bacterium]|nr:molecular chaperone DnaK [Bdellovibrionota bacterium]